MVFEGCCHSDGEIERGKAQAAAIDRTGRSPLDNRMRYRRRDFVKSAMGCAVRAAEQAIAVARPLFEDSGHERSQRVLVSFGQRRASGQLQCSMVEECDFEDVDCAADEESDVEYNTQALGHRHSKGDSSSPAMVENQ